MKKLSFLFARFVTIIFGVALVALVLPFLLSTVISWNADATRFYVAQQEGSALSLIHLPHLLQILSAILFGVGGVMLILDHYYRTTLIVTFTLCVLAAHGLLNGGAFGGWIYLYIPAMFFACLGLLAFIFAQWSRTESAKHQESDSSLMPHAGNFVI